VNNNIHKYKFKDCHIVVDPCSGAVHVVDEATYLLLDTARPPFEDDPNSDDNTREILRELRELYEQDMLYSEDDYERFAFHDGDGREKLPIKSMCLNVAHDCNMRCEYCFAQTGGFGHERALMNPDTAIQAVDFLVRESGERTNLEMDFFGGEPLMAWDAVTAAVTRAKQYDGRTLPRKFFRFTITTNGMLLDDEKIAYINSNMSNVVLSADGRRSVHDKLRSTVNGRPTYDLVMPKFKKLIESRIQPGKTDYYVRGTFTAYNLDFTEDVLALAAEGFRHISLEPVSADESLPYALKREHLDRIREEYDRLATAMIANSENHENFNFFHFLIDLEQGPCAVKRLRGCGAGGEYVAVTPEGDVYPCHQFVGDEKWRMGDIFGGKLNEDIERHFLATNIYTKPKCKHCWARFYCSGGCNAQSYQRSGDLRGADDMACELMKKRIETAIALRAIGM
jgi:uncharacterized protein